MSTFTTAIGIDFGGTSVKSAVVREGKLIHRGAPIDPQAAASSDALLDSLVALIAGMRGDFPDIAGVGIGLPGFVDIERGVVHELTNVAGWNDVPLRDILHQRTGLPVTVENDANAMAYAEYKYGAARGARYVMCITLGTGVGGALVLDGHIFRGAQFAAGEIGHMRASTCTASPGPMATRAGSKNTWAMSRSLNGRRNATGRPARLKRPPSAPRPIFRRPPCAAIPWRPACGMIWPSKSEPRSPMSFGSSIPIPSSSAAGWRRRVRSSFDPIRREIRQRTLALYHERLRVVPAELGNDAGIIGNAALALEAAELFAIPKNNLNGTHTSRSKATSLGDYRAMHVCFALLCFLGVHGPGSFYLATVSHSDSAFRFPPASPS